MTIPTPITLPIRWLSEETMREAEEARLRMEAERSHEDSYLELLTRKGLRAPHEL